METDIVSLMFDGFITNLQNFIQNDITVMLLAMVSLTFLIFAYFKIRYFLGMSTEAREARSAFNRYQSNKDDWRAPLLKEDYFEKLENYRQSIVSPEEEDRYNDKLKRDYL